MSHRPMTVIEKQRAYVEKLASVRYPCPNCHQPLNQSDASATNEQGVGECPKCKRGIKVVVPFMAAQPWLWQLIPEQTNV